MSKDERSKQASRIIEFVERLFGDVSAMSDEEINELFTVTTDDVDVTEKVRNIASRAARKYRLNDVPLPPHVQAALNATKPSIEGASMSKLRQIVRRMTVPLYGSVNEVSYAYRNKTELTDQDRQLLDECSKEVQEDWSEEKPQ